MADVTWPADWCPAQFDWGLRANVLVTVSTYNGAVTTSEIPGARFIARIVMPTNVGRQDIQPDIEAFAAELRGRVNRAVFGHMQRKVPRGTMRGSPTTGGGAQGAQSMVITGTGTWMKGDLFGVTTAVGPQLLMVTAASGTNTVTVNFSPPLKGVVTAASAVVWNYPTTKWLAMTDAIMVSYGPGGVNPGLAIDFMEV